jgi:type II restriction/modification system DNA methylase subunit YeeA
VRVSLVCFGQKHEPANLNGNTVEKIYPELTGGSSSFAIARRLPQNIGKCFMGDTKGGAFEIEGHLARTWLAEPLNANGRPNSDVLRQWVNGLDLTRRERDMWIIDFGVSLSEAEAAIYESPFAHLLEKVKPERDRNRRDTYRVNWWRHVEPRPAMNAALQQLAISQAVPAKTPYTPGRKASNISMEVAVGSS